MFMYKYREYYSQILYFNEQHMKILDTMPSICSDC